MSNVKSIRADRVLSIINLPLLIAVIVYNTLKSGVIPWTDGKEDGPSEVVLGFATYCDAYTGSQTTFLRCWLTNGVWLGLLASAVLWFVLAVYTFTQSSSDIYDDDYDAYDFKADVPMALTPPSAMHKTQVYEPGTPTSYSPSPAPLQPAQSASNADYNYKYYNYPSYEGYYDPAYAPQQQGGYPPYHSPATVAPYTGYEYNGPSAYQNTTPRHEDTVHMMSDMSDTKHLYAQGSGPQQQSPVTAGPPPVPQKDGGFGTEPPHSHDADKQHYNKL
ncbi:hypothetical protein DFQ28_002636 [Apophysomyces sp. BC1034]|nr:hypothetical protein DFQ30_002920 [Apophysomyces sp. BC1015]KAG0179771.1 hypothetical protein DFQ29_001681 [Apophysomyces sp. BC1021]KAG0190002.1 hypothetical protein DFQ28_002636 [Apophysomyces sp. BC1034]